MGSEESSSFPLLVNVQTVDVGSLDFQQSKDISNQKSKQVTFVEASPHFLFVGSISGSVYLFLRESLQFLLLIPFKGGKVCNISVSHNELDLAIASQRGRISLYKLSSSLIASTNQLNKSNRIIVAGPSFTHLYDVPKHHFDYEITELRWSPNGKYLFVGDITGVVVQVDVGSLHEFPRPPPSRIILKADSRVLQIDCVFPYLSICTVEGILLCDLAKEDFTRVQKKDGRKVKAAGTCFTTTPEGSLLLAISEIGSGQILMCGLDGTIIPSRNEVDSAPKSHAISFFDPNSSSRSANEEISIGDLNYSPGRMFALSTSNEDPNRTALISYSSNRTFFFTSGGQILSWNEDFKRINSLKIVSNYGFLWYGSNRLVVFAFTPFVVYGRQLLSSGLEKVLAQWIEYSLRSLGYRNGDENGNNPALKRFRGLLKPLPEEDDFVSFVSSCIPFPLTDPIVAKKALKKPKESVEQRLRRLVTDLTNSVKTALNRDEDAESTLSSLMKSLSKFYSQLLRGKSRTLNGKIASLPDAMKVVQAFAKSSNLKELSNQFEKQKLADHVTNHVIKPILNYVLKKHKPTTEQSEESDDSVIRFLSSYSCDEVVVKYFESVGVSLSQVRLDSTVADIIVLLMPLSSSMKDGDLLSPLFNTQTLTNLGFFSWLVLILLMSEETHRLPFTGLIRTIQHPPVFEKLLEDMISCAYREVVYQRSTDSRSEDRDELAITSFAHFVTFSILFSNSPEVKTERDPEAILLSLFPWRRGPRQSVMKKVLQLCTANPTLLKLFFHACTKKSSVVKTKLCECGIPYDLSPMEVSPPLPQYQSAIEEAVLQALIQTHEKKMQPLVSDPVHQFGMKPSLILTYLQNAVVKRLVPDLGKTEVILRTGMCEALESLEFNVGNVKLVYKALLTSDGGTRNCNCCGSKVTFPYRISIDCLGVWMLNNCSSTHQFLEYVRDVDMNKPGTFSVGFYRLFIERVDKLKNTNNGGRMACTMFHNNLC